MTAIIAVGLMIGTGGSADAIPTSITFTGRLFKDNVPVNRVVTVQFRIFGAPSGGTLYWEELHPSVSVVDGLFSVAIGSRDAMNVLDASVFAGGDLYLEVTVDDDRMTERMALLSVPYAVMASTVVDDGITTNKLADSAVTQAKLCPDAVASHNIVDDAITSADIRDGEINGNDIATDAITGDHVANGEISGVHIAPNSIPESALSFDLRVNPTVYTVGSGTFSSILMSATSTSLCALTRVSIANQTSSSAGNCGIDQSNGSWRLQYFGSSATVECQARCFQWD